MDCLAIVRSTTVVNMEAGDDRARWMICRFVSTFDAGNLECHIMGERKIAELFTPAIQTYDKD